MYIKILIIFIYTIDNGIVQPYVFSKSVNMHPIIIILLIIAGGQLFGLIGMLLAIPVASVIKKASQEIYFAFKNYKIVKM
ncbi:MAG: AI-2E family transporter [Bacteroidetes bacterium]|nr:AI-2E family transporter [Bacteroidota bacterium]